MKGVWVGAGIILALVCQTTLVPEVGGAGAPVDLVLVVVISVAITGGPLAGMWTGAVGGLLQDGLSGGVIGVGGLVKTLVGHGAGQVGAYLMVTRSWHQFLVFFFGSVAHAGCFIGIYSLLSTTKPMSSYRAVLIQAAINAVLGVIMAIGLQVAPSVLARRRLRRRWPTR